MTTSKWGNMATGPTNDTRAGQYVSTIDELEKRASLWWPEFLTDLSFSLSVIPYLLKTQDKFISILETDIEEPEQIFEVILEHEFPANLFLKHLVILTDFGGERLQRLNTQFNSIFQSDEFASRNYEYAWRENTYRYYFRELPIRGRLTNTRLKIDEKNLHKPTALNNLYKDVVMILLYSSNSENAENANILETCDLGHLIGDSEKLKRYIKQKYIIVSRITTGAQAERRGRIAQQFVYDMLKDNLNNDYKITSPGYIEEITQTGGRTLTSFDIVVEKNNKSVAIEISFQVTTNSVIERKAGQANPRFLAIEQTGNYIAYIIDGAGNFERRSAISTICENSHCTIAYTETELQKLINFIETVLP